MAIIVVRAYHVGEPGRANLRPLAPRAALRAARPRPLWRGRAQHRHRHGWHTLAQESYGYLVPLCGERGGHAWPDCRPCGSRQRHGCGAPLLSPRPHLSLQPLLVTPCSATPGIYTVALKKLTTPATRGFAFGVQCGSMGQSVPMLAAGPLSPGRPDAVMSTPGRENEPLPRISAALRPGSAARRKSPG